MKTLIQLLRDRSESFAISADIEREQPEGTTHPAYIAQAALYNNASRALLDAAALIQLANEGAGYEEEEEFPARRAAGFNP